MSKTIGIDLGTTNSAAAYMDKQGKIQIIKFGGKDIVPSSFYYDGERNIKCVGQIAVHRGKVDPENYIHSTKRSIETYEKKFHTKTKSFNASEVATEILKYIREEAAKQLRDDDISAVITIPANFAGTIAAHNTQEAAKNAGFKDVKIITEPVSSVYAYGIVIDSNPNGIYFVCDLGGGTFDVSVVQVLNNNFEVVYKGGNPKLGGDDFTKVVEDLIIEKIRENATYEFLDFSQETIKNDITLTEIFGDDKNYLRAKAKIKDEAERAKCDLSFSNEVRIHINSLYERNNQAVPFEMTLTRKEFEDASNRLINSYRNAIEEAIDDIGARGIRKDQITSVVFAGGSMNIPKMKEIMQEEINLEPKSRDLDTIVARGASIKAASDEAKKNPYNVDGSINPYKDKLIDIETQEILAYNLGVNISSGELSVIIPKGTKYPCTITEPYTTSFDNQENILFNVYEGNVTSEAANPANHKLGDLTISGLIPEAKGKADVHVTFKLDENQFLYVTAVDKKNHAKPVDTKINWGNTRF